MKDTLICGLPRSGTSFLYKISMVEASTLYLNESISLPGFKKLKRLVSSEAISPTSFRKLKGSVSSYHGENINKYLKQQQVLDAIHWQKRYGDHGSIFWKQPSFFPGENFFADCCTKKPLNLIILNRKPFEVIESFQRRANDKNDKWPSNHDGFFATEQIGKFLSWLIDLKIKSIPSRPELKVHIIGYDFMKTSPYFCSRYSQILGGNYTKEIKDRYELYENKFKKKSKSAYEAVCESATDLKERTSLAENALERHEMLADKLESLSGFNYFSKDSTSKIFSLND